MAGTTTHEGVTSAGFSEHFTQGVIDRIEAQAYKMLYDEGVLPKLCKRVGQGSKGSAVIYPYFDPSTFATAASNPAETTDLTYNYQLTNASVIILASEFGIISTVHDTVKEDSIVDVPGEIARQQGLAVAVRLEKHILAKIAAGVTTGTITGTVSDPAGAVIPNTSVIVRNMATGAVYNTVTTGTGNYTVPALPVGGYSLTVAAPGFNQYIQEGIEVRIAVTARVDVVLKIGATADWP